MIDHFFTRQEATSLSANYLSISYNEPPFILAAPSTIDRFLRPSANSSLAILCENDGSSFHRTNFSEIFVEIREPRYRVSRKVLIIEACARSIPEA